MSEADAILRHWRLTVPDDRLAHLVRDAARALGKALSARLAAHGIAFGHWMFLRALWVEDGLMQRELALRAGLSEPTAFAALTEMERLGLVRRQRRAESRRKVFVNLTPKGRALESVLVPLAEEVNAIAAAGCSAAQITAMRRGLLRMIENLAADEARLTEAAADET
jgi:MarR family transcriptional regulator, organic hydroperoxide resistance regulator